MTHWSNANVMVDRDGNVGTLRNLIHYPIVSLVKVMKGEFDNWSLVDTDDDDTTNYSHILTRKGVQLPHGMAYKLLFKVQILDHTPVKKVKFTGPVLDVIGLDHGDNQTFVKNGCTKYECYSEHTTRFVEMRTSTVSQSDSLETCSVFFQFGLKPIVSTAMCQGAGIPTLSSSLDLFPKDCQLVLADGSKLFCHSLVLRASSSFFNTAITYVAENKCYHQTLFTENKNGLLTFNLVEDGFNIVLWADALHFMLYSNVEMNDIERMQDLYMLGDYYQIKGLPQYIVLALRHSLDKWHFIHVNPYLISLLTMSLHFSTSNFIDSDLRHQWLDILNGCEKILAAHPEIFAKNNEEFLVGYGEYLKQRRQLFGLDNKDTYVVLGKRNWSR